VNLAREASPVYPENRILFDLEWNHQDLRWIALMIPNKSDCAACPSFTSRFKNSVVEKVITEKVLLFQNDFQSITRIFLPKHNNNKFMLPHSNMALSEIKYHPRESVKYLHERMSNLNSLVRRRSSLNISFKDQPLVKKESFERTEDIEDNVDSIENCEIGIESVAMTESSKRILSLFERYQNKSIEEINTNQKQTKWKRQLNRLEVKQVEKRKKSIESIHKILQSNSSRYLSRCADSVRFKKPKRNEDEKEAYPIPVQEKEMNPRLLITLSCEKIVVEGGKRMLKTVALHETSQKLFILMYWLIHCRFFQSNSGAEQRYLLQMIADIFPNFMEVVEKIVPVKHGDFIFRYYPFVLSKAIADGFQFLCPGNRSLFEGTFQTLLYLSVFRLLTGLNLCPASIYAQRLKVFPEDVNGDDIIGSGGVERKPKQRAFINVEKKDIIRQQQVHFDAHQISPLIQNWLKRQAISEDKKHILKRTEPVPNCKFGGLETYQSLQGKINIQLSEPEMIKQSKDLKCDLEAISTRSQKQLAQVLKTRNAVLSGGKKRIEEYASKVISAGS
jgi:hypothetical protein